MAEIADRGKRYKEGRRFDRYLWMSASDYRRALPWRISENLRRAKPAQLILRAMPGTYELSARYIALLKASLVGELYIEDEGRVVLVETATQGARCRT